MNRVEITVSAEKAGERIDVFLTDIPGISTRNMAQKLLADGCITCGGKPLAKNYKIGVGDVITCNLPEPIIYEATAEDIPLEILYEDAHLLVINKPRGLVVHPAAGNWEGTLVNALMHYCKGKLSGIGGVLRPGIVHRLDKDTSGIMVVAKSDAAHQGLSAQLADNSMVRIYTAVCCGVLQQDKMRIDAPIGRHPVNRKKMAVFAGLSEMQVRARRAVTYVEVLERFSKHTLISARLETGRTHQIRVHMSYVNHPVLGDIAYGGAGRSVLADGQVLHATTLSFSHPVTGQVVTFTAPLPEYFTKMVGIVSSG